MTTDPRELDAKIAVHFFGWRWYAYRNLAGALMAFASPVRHDPERYESVTTDIPANAIRVTGIETPQFSTDAAAYAMLFDKLVELGWRLIIDVNEPEDLQASASRSEQLFTYDTFDGKTASESIRIAIARLAAAIMEAK